MQGPAGFVRGRLGEDTVRQGGGLGRDDPAQARELLRFAEDQFVGWEMPFAKERISIVDYSPNFADSEWRVVPAVVEQYNYRDAIDASAAKLIFTYLALYRATGNPLDLAKARALGDSMVRVQEPDGRIPTTWRRKSARDCDWINCMLYSCRALDALAELDGKD